MIPIAVGQRGEFYDIISSVYDQERKKFSEGGHDML